MSETIIRLKEDQITVETVTNGVSSVKPTNLEALQQILVSDVHLETPLLPGQWGVQKYFLKGNVEGYVITVPEGVRDVKYDYEDDEDPTDYKIPVPASVWMITVNYDAGTGMRRINYVRAMALANPILSEEDYCYEMPFPNIGSAICWGSSSDTPSVLNAKSLQSVPTQFFVRPFNNDLSDDKFEPFYEDREGHERVQLFRIPHLFEYMADRLAKDPEYKFPTDKLHRRRTLRDEMRAFFGEYLS